MNYGQRESTLALFAAVLTALAISGFLTLIVLAAQGLWSQ